MVSYDICKLEPKQKSHDGKYEKQIIKKVKDQAWYKLNSLFTKRFEVILSYMHENK